METGIELINRERQRQISVEGWTKEHDSMHVNGELALAAKCYETPEEERFYQTVSFFNGGDKLAPVDWPWEAEWWKPSPDDRVKELVKAGALYLADESALGAEKWTKKIYDIASKIDELQGNVKVIFGLGVNEISIINDRLKHWNAPFKFKDEIVSDNKMEYTIAFWKDCGNRCGWEPFTLALHYFAKINKSLKP